MSAGTSLEPIRDHDGKTIMHCWSCGEVATADRGEHVWCAECDPGEPCARCQLLEPDCECTGGWLDPAYREEQER